MSDLYIIQTIGALFCILTIIVVLALALRKMQNYIPKTSGLKLSGGVMLGQKEKLVLVEVNAKWLLLGVTSHHITKLHEFDEKPACKVASEVEAGFSKTLMAMIQK